VPCTILRETPSMFHCSQWHQIVINAPSSNKMYKYYAHSLNCYAISILPIWIFFLFASSWIYRLNDCEATNTGTWFVETLCISSKCLSNVMCMFSLLVALLMSYSSSHLSLRLSKSSQSDDLNIILHLLLWVVLYGKPAFCNSGKCLDK